MPRTFRYSARGADQKPAVYQVFSADKIQLSGGYAFPDHLPDLSEIARRVASDHRTEVLQYGPLFGVPELREAIVDYCLADGVTTSTDNILVLNGAKHALDLLLRVLIDPGDGVIVGDLDYLTALSIIRKHGAEMVEITTDKNGLDVDELETTLGQMRADGQIMPKLLFVVPDFHNPSGVTLPAERRRRLVELAEKYDFLIFEDDPYRRLRYSSEPVPPIKTFDTYGRVVSSGTVSKVFGPGLRVGWANGDPDIIGRMAAFKSDGGSCPITQRIVLEAMRSGFIEQHIEELKPVMSQHLDAMCAAIDRHIPGVSYDRSDGGYYLWMELPEGVNADQAVFDAEDEGVLVFSGSMFYASPSERQNLRLCFTYSTPEQIEEGIRRLGAAIQRQHNLSGQSTTAVSGRTLREHFN